MKQFLTILQWKAGDYVGRKMAIITINLWKLRICEARQTWGLAWGLSMGKPTLPCWVHEKVGLTCYLSLHLKDWHVNHPCALCAGGSAPQSSTGLLYPCSRERSPNGRAGSGSPGCGATNSCRVATTTGGPQEDSSLGIEGTNQGSPLWSLSQKWGASQLLKLCSLSCWAQSLLER